MIRSDHTKLGLFVVVPWTEDLDKTRNSQTRSVRRKHDSRLRFLGLVVRYGIRMGVSLVGDGITKTMDPVT